MIRNDESPSPSVIYIHIIIYYESIHCYFVDICKRMAINWCWLDLIDDLISEAS